MFQAPSLNFLPILPIVIVVIWAIVLMIVDIFLPDDKKRWIAWLSLVGIVLAFIQNVGLWNYNQGTFIPEGGTPMVVVDNYSVFINGIFLLTAFFTAIALTVILGQFKLGLNAQPASHLSHGWTFLSMTLVGLASILIDGCPFRQLIKAGQGDVDACVASLGMLLGGATAYAWLIRSTSAGPTFQGKIAVLLGLIFTLVVAVAFRKRRVRQ